VKTTSTHIAKLDAVRLLMKNYPGASSSLVWEMFAVHSRSRRYLALSEYFVIQQRLAALSMKREVAS